MFEKSKKAVLVLLPAVLLGGWVLSVLWQMSGGEKVKVRLSGYDPRNLLAGHYIRYSLDWNATDCGQFDGGKCPKELFEKYGQNTGWYFVSEELATALEQDFRNDNNVAEMVFLYREGKRPYVYSLLINGQYWNEGGGLSD